MDTSFRAVSWGISSLVLTLTLVGCVTDRNVRPVKEERPVTMFDNYFLRMSGLAIDTFTVAAFVCRLDFKNKVPDTSNFDHIPILVIDSFCFEGACLEEDHCRSTISHAEMDREMDKREGRKPYTSPYPDDLGWGREEGYLFPSGYRVRKALRLPVGCKDQQIVVVVHARLIDRTSGEVIAQDAKRVRFEVKGEKRWFNAYGRPQN